MPWLIDGDNLLGASRRARCETERRSLARQLADVGRREHKRIQLVFDGTEPYPLGSDVQFSGPGRTADDCILARIRGASDPAGWTVVTNDKALGDRCRWLGARVLRCDQFRQRFPLIAHGRGDSPVEKPERESDVNGWLRIFDDQGD